MPQLTSRHRSLAFSVLVLVASVFLFGACDSTGPSTQMSNVQVGFATTYSPSASSTLETGPAAKSSHDSLVVSGSNGTLKITDLHLIVSGVELESDADSADFEAGPAFLDLPLDTTEVAPVTTAQIPPANYDEFEFEVEDVDIEENDEDEQQLQDLRESIREDFPNWPEGASMVAVGTFTQSDGTTSDFTAYFEAEIEVERETNTPLGLTGAGISRSLTVNLDPTRWFSNADGTVQNLGELDYGSTGELIEFEAEFEDGVAEIEVNDADE